MSHGDTIKTIPSHYKIIASTADVAVAGYYVEDEQTYGIQFHPEVYHSLEGSILLKNFIVDICKCDQSWTPDSFVDSTVKDLQDKIGRDKVILGLSGGVDSSVAAVLLHKAIGANLHCIFVDNGLLRKDEFNSVLDSYKGMGLNVKGVDASEKFYAALEGLTDPELKRKAIGKVFIDVFDEFQFYKEYVGPLSGLSPKSEIKERFIEWLGPSVIWELYGGTEGQGSTTIQGQDWLTHKGSVGKPVETCEMKIIGEDGRQLPPGEVGEVYIRPTAGAGTTYRYLGASAKAIDGGWESLGDMGWMDAEGYLYLADRLSDMIIVGGANIYPAEVEAALDAFPGVRSSAVIGLPDDNTGNRLHAIIDRPEGPADEAALLAHLGKHLVRYKTPRTFEWVSEPLRDEAGKVRRSALKKERLKAV
jgi:hypothetical protein